MGRRATATTKGGKYMNPADQARKEARKRELKKNKKVRQEVRKAVLKSKDPEKLIEEMQRLDTLEFSTLEGEQPLLHEKVIQEKRKKCLETLRRVIFMYGKEDKERSFELRRMMHDYEAKRRQLEQHAAAVRFAKEVNPAEIPLPEMPPPTLFAAMMGFPPPADIPLPPSILKKVQVKAPRLKQPPGPPLGTPPQLSDSEDEQEQLQRDVTDSTLHDQVELSMNEKTKGESRVKFADGALGDDDDDEEKDSRSRYKELAKHLSPRLLLSENATSSVEEGEMLPVGRPPGFPPPINVVLRPPPGVRMPAQRLIRPPPPPGVPPPNRAGVPRIPPPPPGFPPPQGHPRFSTVVRLPPSASGVILSAPPTISTGPAKVQQPQQPVISSDLPKGPTIQAGPQLRSMQENVTKLVPTTVLLKRNISSQHISNKMKTPQFTPQHALSSSIQKQKQQTKDDAYEQFMREMQGLI